MHCVVMDVAKYSKFKERKLAEARSYLALRAQENGGD